MPENANEIIGLATLAFHQCDAVSTRSIRTCTVKILDANKELQLSCNASSLVDSVSS